MIYDLVFLVFCAWMGRRAHNQGFRVFLAFWVVMWAIFAAYLCYDVTHGRFWF